MKNEETKTCDHFGAWSTNGGHYYCPKCEKRFNNSKDEAEMERDAHDLTMDILVHERGQIKRFLDILNDEENRDKGGLKFFLSEGNVMPNGDMTSFLYGAKKYNDYLKKQWNNIIKKTI